MSTVKFKTVKGEPVSDDKANGKLIRNFRLSKNISLRSLAKSMKVSAPYLSDLERGNRGWSGQRFVEACNQIVELEKLELK